MNNLNLFKYYAPKYKDEDNISFYTKGSIYFQKPTEFNDPWDCKAPQIKCPRGRKALKKIWFKLSDQKGQDYARIEWEKIRGLTRTETKRRFVKLFEKGYEGLRSKIGVFSLSFIPDSELMWSHYASSHSGYMLHFQIDPTTYYIDPSLKNETIPIPVIYSNKREYWNLEDYYANKKNMLTT